MGAEPRSASVVVALGSTQKLWRFPVKTPEEFSAEAQVPPAIAADTLERKVHLMSNLLKGTRNALSRVIAHLAVQGIVSLPRDGDVVRHDKWGIKVKEWLKLPEDKRRLTTSVAKEKTAEIRAAHAAELSACHHGMTAPAAVRAHRPTRMRRRKRVTRQMSLSEKYSRQ